MHETDAPPVGKQGRGYAAWGGQAVVCKVQVPQVGQPGHTGWQRPCQVVGCSRPTLAYSRCSRLTAGPNMHCQAANDAGALLHALHLAWGCSQAILKRMQRWSMASMMDSQGLWGLQPYLPR